MDLKEEEAAAAPSLAAALVHPPDLLDIPLAEALPLPQSNVASLEDSTN